MESLRDAVFFWIPDQVRNDKEKMGSFGFVFLTFGFAKITVTPYTVFNYTRFVNVKIGFVLQKKRFSSFVSRIAYRVD